MQEWFNPHSILANHDILKHTTHYNDTTYCHISQRRLHNDRNYGLPSHCGGTGRVPLHCLYTTHHQSKLFHYLVHKMHSLQRLRISSNNSIVYIVILYGAYHLSHEI